VRRLILWLAALSPLLFVLGAIAGAPWRGLVGMLIPHALVVYATLRPNVQWLGPVVTHFAANGQEVWLTIDDGPTEDTPALLRLLASRRVLATFFVKGSLVERHPDFAAAIVAGGHSIANHSQTHPSGTFWCLSPSAIAREIDRCASALNALGPAGDGRNDKREKLFRAPVGMKNPFVHPALERRFLTLVGWSIRTFDAVRSDTGEVVARTVRQLEPGAIIVMHQGRSWSLRTIEAVIDEVMARGYTFVIPPPDRFRTKR
jgi:peptidoglycan/xylan/chitin deacetylase (PgdA/CDA1 family)